MKILSKWLNSSIWPTDRTLTGFTPQGQSRPGSNGNEELIFIPQSFSTVATPSNSVLCYMQDTWWWGRVLTFFAEVKLMYSTAPADKASYYFNLFFWKRFLLTSKQSLYSLTSKSLYYWRQNIFGTVTLIV